MALTARCSASTAGRREMGEISTLGGASGERTQTFLDCRNLPINKVLRIYEADFRKRGLAAEADHLLAGIMTLEASARLLGRYIEKFGDIDEDDDSA